MVEPESHKIHEGYSSSKPVPKVSLRAVIDDLRPSGGTEAKAKRLNKEENDGSDEQKKTADKTKKLVKGKEVRVTDPVTGEETMVKHGADSEEDLPKGENVLSLDLPPPDWEGHRTTVLELTRSSVVKIGLAYVVFPSFVYFLLSLPIPSLFSPPLIERHPYFFGQILLIVSLIPPSFLAYSLVFALERKSTEDYERRAWDSERTRGLNAGRDSDGDGNVEVEERFQESAEWVNALVRGVWPIMNTELFSASVDMLEDIMQASVPKFVHSVRVADLGLGSTPVRITAIRSLPDGHLDEELAGADDSIKEHLTRDHINVELSFAYRALPSGASASSKAHNAHLLIDFYLGMKGVWQFNVPVWVELTGVTGTARARIELIPDPPFIKTTLVTLMGLPRVSIKVVPMMKSLPNMMNLPVISDFIAESIDAACAEYVAPKSMTLDLQQLISGDDIKKDTEAIGVIIIHIHRAVGLMKMDSRESSDSAADPYVTVAYSRQGKPLYSTRIMFDDLNPVFEETTAVTLDSNAVKIREKITLQLWDSDRTSADDMMGYVEVDVLDLMRNKNKPMRKFTRLTSPDAEDRPGSIEFTMGYYSKMAPNSKLETDGSDPSIPEDLKNDPAFKEARAVALNDLEAAVLVTPPDPEWPSGILSIQVHELRELKVQTQGREKSMLGSGRNEGDKGQDADGEEQEEGTDLPSSYCTIAINDELVYSTRVKPITSSPAFNAGTERFIRDWRNTHVSVVVRDSRLRENDPILGIIFLKLSDLLMNASEVTRFFPLEHGVGYGSARVSVLFRPVQAFLPKNLLGFESGTVHIHKLEATAEAGGDDNEINELKSCKLSLSTSYASDGISKKDAEVSEEGIEWQESDGTILPVRQRYSKALSVSFVKGSLVKDKKAMAVLWLQDVVDNEKKTYEVALWKADSFAGLKQNYVPLDGKLDMWAAGAEKLKRIGTLRIEMTFVPGIKDSHRKRMNSQDSSEKRSWDEADRREAAGLSKNVGERAVSSQKDESGGNTEVDRDEVQHNGPEEDGDRSSSSDAEDEDDNEGKGLMKKLRKWKKHEKDLHREHRGIMQTKPARTAEWMKDNVEDAVHGIKGRFTMEARQPDVETEV